MALSIRKAKMRLTFREEKPEVYKYRQLTYVPVTYDQLVNFIQVVGVNKPQTKAVVDALLESLIHYMEIGHAVQLGKFGTFKPTFTSKTARSLKEVTQDTIKVKKIQFYPGGAFRNMLQNLTLKEDESVSLEDEEEDDDGD